MEETIAKMFKEIVEQYPDQIAQLSKDREGKFQPTSYRQLYEEVKIFGSGLISLGIKRGDKIGLISDDRKEWLIADLAILGIGAVDVPRGCDTLPQEIGYILKYSDCETTLVENADQLEKVLSIKKDLPGLKRIIGIEENPPKSVKQKASGIDLLSFQEVMEKGKQQAEKEPDLFDRELKLGKNKDLATIIFTSGTTGEPKGVMLSHENFLYQVRSIPGIIDIGPGDIWLNVLPVWHSFERVLQYIALGWATAMAYSKPIGRIMLPDFEAVRPTWMAGVPRLWEAIMAGVYRNANSQGGVKRALFYFFVAVGKTHAALSHLFQGLLPQFKRRYRFLDIIISIIPLILLTPLQLLGNLLVFKKIKKKLGGRFVAGVSGGGALPGSVDKFFSAAGILLLEGYGLTETSPVISVRKQGKPVFGTIGPPLPGTEVRIVDDNLQVLPPGKKGVLMARGPQVMLGYLKNPEKTAEVISTEGWFNTGDLAMLTHKGEIKIVGRAKDTIVLRGGENIEPAPIEERLQESKYIIQAVVLGQDQKFLAALVVPNLEEVEEFAKEINIPYLDKEDLVDAPEVNELIGKEIREQINPKSGFRAFERIFRFKLIARTFEVGRELSHKQDVMRHAINDLYRKEIEELFR